MKDLTQGPIARHIITMAIPIMAGMLLQTLYYIVDLYFVSRLGSDAVAGVSAAGNAMFLIFSLTQTLGVGIVALISHAVGRKDQADANLIFNQSIVLSALCALLTVVLGYFFTSGYMGTLGADAGTAEAGTQYLYWFLPGLALQFALVAMGSALRGTGIVKPTMVVQALTVLLNIVLAPILIAGWGTGRPLGVAGAGLASSISIAGGVLVLTLYFVKLEKYVSLHPEQWQPRMTTWARILKIGLPAGGEFGLMFVYMVVIFWIIRDFGAAAQAGFGVGMRVMQSIFLPAMALAFAAAPIVGQNFGARLPQRVRDTFRTAALMCSATMFLLTLFCLWRADLFVRFFTEDPPAIAVGAQYLHIISWNFVAAGLVFTCSSTFQGLGNTWPSLISSASRLVTFVIPAVWLAHRPGFQLEQMWYLSVITVTCQALFSLWLVRGQFRTRLVRPDPDAAAVAAGHA